VDIDQVLQEMGANADRLASLAEDAFDERLELRQRQEQLRLIASDLSARAPVDRHALQAELDHLLGRWDALQKERIDVVAQSGGGSQGGDAFSGAHAVRVNLQIDAARGRDQIESRIAEIRRLLDSKPKT
jgi:hypothetical protein